MNELVMHIIEILVGCVVVSGAYSTIQYFRLYRPLMKSIKEMNSSECEEAK